MTAHAMKFVSFLHHDSACLGWLQDDGISLCLVNSSIAGLPGSMDKLLTLDSEVLSRISAAKDKLASLPLDQVTLLPPLTQPMAIFCVGLNYAEHEREAPVSGTDFPTMFLRLARNQVAQGEAIVSPASSQTLDWEGELVAVIGKGGRHIAAENAFDHIFGYSIYNEASVREFQHHSSQFGLGKIFDNTGAFGPWLVTADEFGDPYSHHIKTDIDGELVQSAQIDSMIHRIEDVIAYISSATALQPGDLICTGTPAGVGAARKPQRFLQAGERVSVTISGIGTLTNPVKAES